MMKRNLLFLLIFIVSTMTVWADYTLNVVSNYEGGASLSFHVTQDLFNGGYHYTLNASYFENQFKRGGNHNIVGWAESATGAAIYGANEQITLTGDLTLYAIWDDSPSVLTYTFNETSKTAALTGYSGAKPTGILEIPATVTVDNVEYSMTSIGQDAFSNCTGLTSVTIPNSVTSIGESAFWYCTGLTSVTIPNSVTSIGDCAFKECKGLTSVTIPNGLTSINGSVFSGCETLTSITIPNSVTSIGNEAFAYCGNLTSITIPNSVTSIGDGAFFYCTGLTSITIPNSVTSIEAFAFNSCTGLSSVYVLATTPPDLGANAFSNNKGSGRKIYVPSGSVGNSDTNGTYKHDWSAYADVIEALPVTASGNCGTDVTWTLYGNSLLVISGIGVMTDYVSTTDVPWNNYKASITFVEIGSSVTSIGRDAFESCSGLTSITIPNSVKSIGEGAFSSCTGLTSVTIPNSVTSIEICAFAECSGLTSVTIPASVTSIGDGAFNSCTGLTSVTIPNSVTSIGHFAFSSCTNLTSVTIYAPLLTKYGSDAFGENAENRKIYVFSDCVNAYKSGWGNYADDIKPITLTANDAGGTLGRWCTYYNGLADVTVAEGTTVYTAKLNNQGGVTLTPTGSPIIKRGEAVLLNSSDNITLSSASSAGTGVYTDNALQGVDVATSQAANTTYYVLSKIGDNFGFYKLKETVKLGANKAYLAVANSNAREFYGFDIDAEATKIVNTDYSDNTDEGDGQIYDLQGRKVQQPVRGIYVQNGKKIVVK